MKKSIFLLGTSALLTTAILSSCNSEAKESGESSVNVDKAKQDLDKAQMNYNKQIEAFKKESEAQISANKKIISDLKDNSKTMKSKAKMMYENTLDSLEKRNEIMNERIEEYEEEGSEKWEAFKLEFKHDINEIGIAIKDLTVNNTQSK